ncbi:MAG TPA: hypothetical protein VF159_03555 [Gemmatimonadaceae bacterium]
MSQRLVVPVAALALLAAVPTTRSVGAQSPERFASTGRSVARVSVDNEALAYRAELNAAGAGRIVSTLDGSVVARIGWFGSELRPLSERSPETARAVARFQHDWGVGRLALLAGSAVAAGALVRYGQMNSDRQIGMTGAQAAAFTTGGLISLYGGIRMSDAQGALERALR